MHPSTNQPGFPSAMPQYLLFYCIFFLTLLHLSLSADPSPDGFNPEVRGRHTPDEHDDTYIPDFPALSRSIIGRQDSPSSEDLRNNVPATTNTIEPGDKLFYRFPSSALYGSKSTLTPIIPNLDRRQYEQEPDHSDLRKRANEVRYFLTLSTCSQPTSSTNSNPPGQLLLFISYRNPTPDGSQLNAHVPNVNNGFSSFSDNTTTDIFVGVEAPSANGYTGSYTFELTVSIDDYYSFYDPNQIAYFIDTDNTAATFVSGILADNTKNDTLSALNRLGPQYTAVVANQADQKLSGLMGSTCALRNTTTPGGSVSNQQNVRVETGLQNITGPAKLQQQFYMSGLQPGTSYYAAMLLPSRYGSTGSGKPGGGGIVTNQIAFTTKIIGNCKIIYNQTSCPQVNYAVPFNPSNFSGPNLTQWYDAQYQTNVQFFDNALDQIACNTSPESQYSLAVTCEDCKDAYSDWLCAVLNPRCEDFTAQQSYLFPRAISYPFPPGTSGPSQSPIITNQTLQNRVAFNSSRNPNIDTNIAPGPYKELLPCGDLCYGIVRSCPAAMGFACPYNPQGFNSSYGYALMDANNNPQCNDPKAVFGVGSGSTIKPSLLLLFGFLLIAIALG